MLAEMGNDSFLLGSVDDTYDDLINTPVCKAACTASILESLPDCSDCAFSPFCGTCPVINLAFDGDIFSKTPRNYRCKVYSGMITVLFEVLQRGNESEINVLKSWVRGDS
jgi:radical SAM protein with 4Fe4S-binding SPASM domain